MFVWIWRTQSRHWYGWSRCVYFARIFSIIHRTVYMHVRVVFDDDWISVSNTFVCHFMSSSISSFAYCRYSRTWFGQQQNKTAPKHAHTNTPNKSNISIVGSIYLHAQKDMTADNNSVCILHTTNVAMRVCHPTNVVVVVDVDDGLPILCISGKRLVFSIRTRTGFPLFFLCFIVVPSFDKQSHKSFAKPIPDRQRRFIISTRGARRLRVIKHTSRMRNGWLKAHRDHHSRVRPGYSIDFHLFPHTQHLISEYVRFKWKNSICTI